jgi:hypothetical protein
VIDTCQTQIHCIVALDGVHSPLAQAFVETKVVKTIKQSVFDIPHRLHLRISSLLLYFGASGSCIHLMSHCASIPVMLRRGSNRFGTGIYRRVR